MNRPKMFAIWMGIALGGSGTIAVAFADAWTGPWGRFLTVVHLMPVLLATIFVQGPILKQPVLAPLGLNLKLGRWWLIAWLSPVLLLALGVLFAWLIFGVDPVLDAQSYVDHKRALLSGEALESFDAQLRESPPPSPIWFWLVVQGLPAGVTLNMLVALAGEIGFRGFLFREVRGGFWRRALLIGLAEAAFLALPAAFGHFFPEHPLRGAASIAAWALVASPVLVYLRVRADSTVAVAIFRGTVLALGVAAAEIAWTAEDWQRPFFGVAGVAAMLVALGACALHDRFVAKTRLIFAPAPGAEGQGAAKKKKQPAPSKAPDDETPDEAADASEEPAAASAARDA
ncbi:MAG TPA: hypothetical protein RMH85_34745 [Polyangiaceae bacterium LLY-WYZ-15_(1-7)]|nr:hypothetical protein [Polyangiaceae bacterium LLY-WYZ-15_(1-7)]HJL00187.1 hypothetical protein [Polyangiaceae bacterium LLY-WYZ-15_(1-7)]HJL13696.1 hypothetical protein [Polyangiaceae bacterium LLY-WYZ-15_(1-7)]HJL32058.1 hypothetical protein [Polyangiaceae bacterium LLY-WYZ-15_(1-7)]HJL49276.1 hypothetical protein [Polyangiaceae bacterium LLY-WYZ-15_(1-7)]